MWTPVWIITLANTLSLKPFEQSCSPARSSVCSWGVNLVHFCFCRKWTNLKRGGTQMMWRYFMDLIWTRVDKFVTNQKACEARSHMLWRRMLTRGGYGSIYVYITWTLNQEVRHLVQLGAAKSVELKGLLDWCIVKWLRAQWTVLLDLLRLVCSHKHANWINCSSIRERIYS